MSEIRYTPRQTDALDLTRGKLVLAGAGSGKTTVLVERYMRLLDQLEYFPDQVVAVTFTRKAAAQLKSKVYKTLLKREAMDQAPGRDFWRERRERMPWARISTIHSFCGSLLRAYPFEAGVDPGFSVKDQGNPARFTQVHEHIRRLGYQRNADLEILLNALGSRDAIENLVLYVISNRGLQEALKRMLDNPDAAKQELDSNLGMLVADWPETMKTGTTKKAPEATPGTHGEYIHHLQALAHVALPLVSGGAAPDTELSSDDLEQLTLRLLSTQPEVAKRIRRSMRTLLIDEFQDTSTIQWEIFQLLTLDQNGNFDPDRLFLVGDEKQSIYGFREANVTVVQLAMQKMCGTVDREAAQRTGRFVNLNDNFRTLPPLVDTLNPVFDRLLQPPHSKPLPFEAIPQPLSPMRSTTDAPGGPLCELMLAPCLSDEVLYQQLATRLKAEIGTVQVVGENGLRPLEEDDIIILLRTRGRLTTIADALRAAGLHPRPEGEGGFAQRQEVLDQLNLLLALGDQRDRVAWTGVWREPFFNFPDTIVSLFHLLNEEPLQAWQTLAEGKIPPDWPPEVLSEEAVSKLRQGLALWRELEDRKDSIAPADLLLYALTRSGALAAYASGIEGEQRVANVFKLLDIIRGLAGQGALSVRQVGHALVELFESGGDEVSGQADLSEGHGIRILTYHKSKGLEFPYVVLADLTGGMKSGSNKRGGNLMIPSGPYRELGNPALYDLGMLDVADESRPERPLHWWMREVFSPAEAEAEEKRLMYVAATRARDRLLLVSRATFKKDGSLSAGRCGSLPKWLDALQVESENETFLDPPDDRIKLTLISAEAMDTSSLSGNTLQAVDLEKNWQLPTEPIEDPQVRLASPEPPDKLVLSVTAFGAYLAAPGKASIHKLFEDGDNEDASDDHEVFPDDGLVSQQFPRETASEIGSLVHRLYQRFGPGCSWEQARSEVHSTLDLLVGKNQVSSIESWVKALFEHGRSLGLHTIPLQAKREVGIRFELGPLTLTGRADLAWLQDGTAYLLDYKTNRWDANSLDQRIHEHGYDHQARLYALALMSAWQTTQAQAELVFLSPGVRKSIAVTEADWTFYRKAASEFHQLFLAHKTH